MDPRGQSLSTGVLIIGASHAGVECAYALRAAGYTEPVTLLGAEPHEPYQRPPLSKAYLAGTTSSERISLRSPEAYDKQQISVITGDTVQHLDTQAKKARTESGREITFEHCVLATGSRARDLPALSGERVYSIRTLDDSKSLQDLLKPGFSLLVVGGGYLGLEVASTAAKLGVEVVVFEHSPYLMSGRVSVHTSSQFEAMHTEAGITLLREAMVLEWEPLENGWRAHMSDGATYQGDAVLVSVGAIPNTELAHEAGLTCDGGIVVDESCRSSAEDVYAIGDCASSYRDELGMHARVESVQNALEQARLTAAAIAGRPLPARRAPTFWSEQHGCRLQIAGLTDPTKPCRDEIASTAKGWVVERYQDGLLAAVEAVDSPVEFVKTMKRLGAVDSPT